MPINILVAYAVSAAKLSVQITDEGQGLDEQMQRRMKRILEHKDGYEEVRPESDDSHSEFYRSLRICKSSVKRHFGSIRFYSNEERRGTTFEFNMRMRKDKKEQMSEETSEPKIYKEDDNAGIKFFEQLPSLLRGNAERNHNGCASISEDEEEEPYSSRSDDLASRSDDLASSPITISNRDFGNQSEVVVSIGTLFQAN